MPIKFSKEKGGWVAEDITKEEQEELIKLGMNSITSVIGEALYRTLATAIQESEDENVKKH